MTSSLCICHPRPDLRQYAHFNDRLMPQSPPLIKSNGRAPHRRAPLYLRQIHRKTLTRRQEPVLEHVVVENTFRRGNCNNSIYYSERHIPPRRTDWPIAPTVTLTHFDTNTCNAVKLNEKLTQIPALNLLAQRCTNNQFCAKKFLSCLPFLQADPGLRNPRKSHA